MSISIWLLDASDISQLLQLPSHASSLVAKLDSLLLQTKVQWFFDLLSFYHHFIYIYDMFNETY